ncbi:RNA pseudouridylate synthase domain-containing protein 1-like [Bacillus rossius redtenbacheri]|uniref:RNA pseudouridylate synthase domain-containing protein 1-like n=1 Tax=Bacillus rossius redtenbacheri TaxID=93214 RepID=UPI002FDDE305
MNYISDVVFMFILSYIRILWDKLSPFLKTLTSKAKHASVDSDRKILNILHKSTNFIVVNKDYDVVINSDDPSVEVSLQTQLHSVYPELVNHSLKHDFYFVHRLDYATSGVICVALNKRACSDATACFSARRARKYYVALVRGHVAWESARMDEAIGADGREGGGSGSHRMCVASSPHCESPRPASTRAVVAQRGLYDGAPATKLLLRPITGRRHQLRVHCASAGHTIVGDYTYSDRTDVAPYRMFLHALRLVLPIKSEPLDIRTDDSFTSHDPRNLWIPIETVNTMDTSFEKLDSGDE